MNQEREESSRKTDFNSKTNKRGKVNNRKKLRVKISNNRDYEVTTTVNVDQGINDDGTERQDDHNRLIMNSDEYLGEEEIETRKLLDRYKRNVRYESVSDNDITNNALVSLKQMKIVLSRRNGLIKYPSRQVLNKELKVYYDCEEVNVAKVQAFMD